MLSLLLIAPLYAGALRVCASTEASASANAAWQVLGDHVLDGDADEQEGGSFSRASITPEFGGSTTVSLCPLQDTRRGPAPSDRGMMEVDAPGSCASTVRASSTGQLDGWATTDPGALHVEAGGRSQMDVEASSGASIGVDGGAGGSFAATWAVRSPGPDSLLSGTLVIGVAEAYAGASIHVPGVVEAEASDGWVEASVRRDGRWVTYRGPAPATLEIRAVIPNRSTLCATGSASAGGVASLQEPGFVGEATIVLDLKTSGIDAPYWIDRTPVELSAECGCR